MTDLKLGFDGNGQTPLPFYHYLHKSELFSDDRLSRLAAKYDNDADSFVAGSASAPDTAFRTVESGKFGTYEAYKLVNTVPLRILFKRVENHDPDFRILRDRLFEQILEAKPELKDQKLVRFETAIFISSGSTTTPFHFDPEVNFFMQIAGHKEYHVYNPATVSEDELDEFYSRQVVDIAQVPLKGRPKDSEHVFQLRAGDGFYQPLNSPHWVRTGEGRSISYSLIFETEAMKKLGRARAFNYYARKLGVNLRDATAQKTMKAAIVSAALPVKRQVGKLYRSFERRSAD